MQRFHQIRRGRAPGADRTVASSAPEPAADSEPHRRSSAPEPAADSEPHRRSSGPEPAADSGPQRRLVGPPTLRTVLVCPTAFKGTLSAAQAVEAMAAGARAAGRDAASIVRLPLSDGGDGLLDAVAALAPSAERHAVRVMGPSGDAVRAEYLSDGPRSILESALVCGLGLVPAARRDPLAATSFGIGELILAAGRGPLVLGLGGSATVDGGAGMARALGWRLLDGAGRPVPPGGGGLRSLRRVVPPVGSPAGGLPFQSSADTRAAGGASTTQVVALADVRNPLIGEEGAAAVFAPQKGADDAAVAALEEGLSVLAERLRADLGVDVAHLPGAGAAGGLGAGAVAFLGARLVSGSEWMLDEARFDAQLERASVLVTGEGAFDGQSGMGKIVGSVVDRAARAGVPAVVLAGRADAPDRPGVLVRTGAGRRLDADGLARLTATALAEVTAGGGGD